MEVKEEKAKKQPTKAKTKRRENKQKPRKLFRRKSLKSMGSLVNKIFKTFGTLTHFKDVDLPDAEDDDGGFRDSTPCKFTASSGNLKGDIQVARDRIIKKSLTLSSHGSIKERLPCCYGEKTPGVLGLKNHGNTCFMNAVIQCLSNTDLFAEYLGLELYKSDFIKRANGILSEDAQYVRGEVTEQLASLVRALWTLEYTPQLSVEFKNTVSKCSAQFRGNSQQDALEFLLWLLDRVHEDVNSSPRGRHRKTKASAAEAAGGEETPSLGSACPPQPSAPGGPYSFVQEHFQAQYKSSLTCPHCLKQSNTFDPFLCISLPIPLRQTRHVTVTLVFSTRTQRYLRVGLAVPLLGSLACLRRMVADEGKISPEQVILTEIYPTGFQRSFFDEDDLSSIAESDVIYAFQAPPLYGRAGPTQFSGNHHSLPSSPYSSGSEGQRLPPSGALSSEFLNRGGSAKTLLLVCNTAGAGQQAVRFGPPFLMREDRSAPWHQLQQSILGKLSYLMLNGGLVQNAGALFKIRVVGGSATCSYLSPQDGRPLYHSAVDRALKFCRPGGPPHVKLIVEWDPKIKERVFGNLQEELVQDADSVRSQQEQQLQQHSCTLDECFQLYTKEEQLAPDDAWKCPHCQQLQQGRVKMNLWTLPDILILHLKRFRQVGERRHKLCTLVRFPLAGLDMGPHAVHRGPWPPAAAAAAAPPGPGAGPPPDCLYDLYAVCNHHGGMHGGHYTAYCRNSVDGQWYCYDDSNVDLLPEGEICTRGAYILFYQKCNTIPPWSASCSNRGSTSSSASDHWLVRLTGSSKRGSLASRTSSACPAPTLPSQESPVFQHDPPEPERGGFESRPLVRGVQSWSVSMGTPTKSKAPPPRPSLRPRDRHRSAPDFAPVPPLASGELVEYLESGRRPRCTKDSIIPLMTSPPEEVPQHPRPPGGGPLGSARVPTGQCGPPVERGSGLKLDTALSWRGSERTEQDRFTTKGFWDGGRDFGSGDRLGSAPTGPSSWDSELKREWANSRAGGGETGREKGGHDGLLSFLRPVFLKRDGQRRAPGGEGAHGSPTRPSRSSGALTGGPAEGKLNGAPAGRGRRCEELANGGAGRGIAHIRRSQSSSNIHGRLHGSAPPHRKDPAAVPPQNPAHAPLLRPCHSTTSLGKGRPVSESQL
ncbi:ubiquitin carboxyl-terminal hydrolase 43-like [Anguilla rostrata]|uniref:ubiquitin carboxyl-terminal hydrolase 43-like n=1 Tax=Anguilla rostrata TaxID=7938 RepID=UPI0030CE910E